MTERQSLFDVVRYRLRWYRKTNLCARLGHFWRPVEPGVQKCRVCKTTLFGPSADDEAIFRVLGGHVSTCAYWSSNPPHCTCGAQQ